MSATLAESILFWSVFIDPMLIALLIATTAVFIAAKEQP